MKRLLHILIALSAFSLANVFADTLELADGTLLEGDFVGSSNGIVMFNTGDGIEAFPEDEVAGIFLSQGVATRQAEAPPPPAAKAKAPAPAPKATNVTIPSGTRLVLRTSDAIDSRRHQAGHRFRAQLESAIVIDGITAVPRGAFVHGRIAQASQGGRAVGSSSLAIEFTDLMINDQLFEIATDGMESKTGNEAGRTVGRTARAAVIGGLLGGSSGARTGAAVGVGASILTSGASINVPAGTILETRLRVPVTVPR
jgi:hypothetical protein